MTGNAASSSLREVVQNLEQGQLPKATALACAALSRGEIHPLFLNLRAAQLELQGHEAAALSDLLQAHQLAPEDAAVSNALGLAFMKLDRYFEALKAFDTAVGAAPLFAAAHFNKGTACEATGDLDDARRSFEQAAAIEPGVAEPVARLAALAARLGNFEEAIRMGREALALQPDHPTALRAMLVADIESGRLGEAESGLHRQLERTDLSEFDRYMMLGLLGDLLEKQGRYAAAFAAYIRGNEDYYHAVRPHFPVSASASIQWLTRYYSTNSPMLATNGGQEHGAVACHVFLVGFPRSGTTLLEQILATHPQVVTMEEKEAFTESIRAFMTGPEQHAKLATLAPDERDRFREAYWRRVREYGNSPAGKIFVDKLPLHAMKLPLIATLFPNAKILFALRDPRDVVLSCLRGRFRMNPYMVQMLRLQDATTFYSDFMALAELYRKTLRLAICDVRHEDLISNFDGVSREVCRFLGLEWSSGLREFSSRPQMRAIATPSARQIAGGLSRAGVGRWRSYISQLAPVMPMLQPWVTRFGYADV